MFGKFRYVAKNVIKDNVTLSLNFTGLHWKSRGIPIHKFSVPFKISQKKAKKLQEELRYHPKGYGFFDFKQVHTKTYLVEWIDGKWSISQEVFETSWCCHDSCD